MIGIEKPSITAADMSGDGSYGKFVLEPLERGYGTTIGNSLRRVLMSSLKGYAITSVKIDGILHEFSTIEGVKEDVTEIVLNLKNVILKIYGNNSKTMYIDVTNVTEITAGYDSSWFVGEYGCDAYFRNNRELLFDETRSRILEKLRSDPET